MSENVEMSAVYEVEAFRPRKHLPNESIDIPEISEDSIETYTDFFNYARNRELISGLQWSMVMRLQSGAEDEFLGGAMTDIELVQYVGGFSTISRSINDIDIPEFEGTKEVSFSLGVPKTSGVAQLRFALETHNDQDISLEIMGEKQMEQPFRITLRVLNREMIRILHQLYTISNTLTESDLHE